MHQTLDVPGPHPPLLLGPLWNTLSYARNPIRYLDQLFQHYSPVAALAAGGGTRIYSPNVNCAGTVFTHQPDLVEQILTQPDVFQRQYSLGAWLQGARTKPERQASLNTWGQGLFAVSGETHLRHRTLLMPAFHRNHIAAYRDTIVGATERLLDSWRPHQTRNLASDMSELTMHTISELLFAGGGNEERDLIRAIQQAFDLLSSPATHLLQLDLTGMPYRRLLNLAAYGDGEIRRRLHKRRTEDVDRGDLLSMLVLGQNDLTDDEIVGHIESLFLAGFATTTGALTWALFLLMQHPQVMADLCAELDREVAGLPPTVEQLRDLPLLDAVVKETLRLFPPALIYRTATRDVALGDYAIPASTEVCISILHAHRNPTVYPRPTYFDPSRWIDSAPPPPYTYLPFGAGRRRCVGAPLADMEIKLVLATMLPRWRPQLLPETTIDCRVDVGITVLPRGGLRATVVPQDCDDSAAFQPVSGDIHELVTLP